MVTQALEVHSVDSMRLSVRFYAESDSRLAARG